MRQYTLPLVSMQAQAPRRGEQPQPQQQKMIAKVSISILVMALPVLYVAFLHVPPSALFRDTTFWFLMSNSIIIVIAADSGMLFFGSPAAAYDDHDDVPFVVSGEPVAVFRSSHDASSVAVSGGDDVVLPALPLPVVVKSQEQLVPMDNGGVVVAETNHALVVRGGGGDTTPASGESTALVSSSSAPAAEYLGCSGEAAMEVIKNVDGATVQARPAARLTASKSLAKEERARRRRSRSHSHALVPMQDKSVVVVREDKLRRTATEPRAPHPASAEEGESDEYERLSDEELNRRVEEFITRFNREIRLQMEKELPA